MGAAVNSHIAFSWNGLPQYAARLIRAAIDKLDTSCPVVGSLPSVPVTGMEEVLGQRVYWVDAKQEISWGKLGLPVPYVYLQSGWSYPAFSSLGREVKAHGGNVIGLSDANWRGDLRQLLLGPVLFRVLYRRHFDAMLVPGQQGKRLMRYFGMPSDRVRCGMYGADQAIFSGGLCLAKRPREFLFVGQLISRKDVLGLARAFIAFSDKRPDWRLRICGSGVQRSAITAHPRIAVEDFVPPEQLAKRYQNARFLVLPSLTEAWGLVVHEAALCGCALLLSDAIGSGDDLATDLNAIRFKAGHHSELVAALHAAADREEIWLEGAEVESRKLAAGFGLGRFALEVSKLVAELQKQRPIADLDGVTEEE